MLLRLSMKLTSGRHISTGEAVWLILAFHIHERHPTVVHLENGQRVYFTAQNLHSRILTPSQTTLTAFFSLCEEDSFARTLHYTEVPKYYTWNAAAKKFQRRKRGKAVDGHSDLYASDALGRIYTVQPNNQECFFLRLLLIYVRGPRSFADLKTVNGRLCASFREAWERNLLENDSHWDTTLADASNTASPSQIRTLFAILVTTCFFSHPKDLWDKYKDYMSEDILHRLRETNQNPNLSFSLPIYYEALILVEEICLSIVNKRLAQFGMYAPERSVGAHYDRDLARETNIDIFGLGDYVENNLAKLLPEQREVYDTILQATASHIGGLHFIDAPGGTGKTFLIPLILAIIRSRNEIALAIASSGIAAALLDGGRTAHSALKLPLDLCTIDAPTCGITKNSGMGTVLKTCKLIIRDECTMAHKKALDRTLRDLRGDARSFGGALIVLSGDFRQTLPVAPRGTPADESNACLKSSILWRYVKKLTLETNMRVRVQNDESAGRFAK